MNLVHDFIAALEQHPERDAIRTLRGETTSRATLIAHIAGLVCELHEAGFSPGDRVCIQTPGGHLLTAAVIASLWLGGTPVLAEPAMGRESWLASMEEAAPRWTLTHPLIEGLNLTPHAPRWLARRDVELPPRYTRAPHTRRLTRAGLARRATSIDAVPAPVERDPEHDALILFTGGTTSRPKGVRLTQGGISAFLHHLTLVIDALPPIDCLAADTPQQVLYALRMGCAALPTQGRRERRADTLLKAIEEGVVDAYFGAPFIWQLIGERAKERPLPSSLRTVLLGSAPVTPSFLEGLFELLHPETRVRCIYGLTEIGPACTVDGREKLAAHERGDDIGRPLPGVQVSLDGDGEVGELLLRSDSLYAGYLNETPRPPDAPLRTGDLATIHTDEDGAERVVLVGRGKDMIVRASFNIYPALYEPRLEALRDPRSGERLIARAALLGIYDETRHDEQVIACLERTRAGEVRPRRELERQVCEALGEAVAPDRLVFWDGVLPVTGRQNKLDKARMRAMIERGEAGEQERATPDTFPFRFEHFVQKQRSLVRRGEWESARREGALRLPLWGVNAACWRLDERLAPGWRERRVVAPVMILGHQRSGTTALHRALLEDVCEPGRAHGLTLGQMLLPTVTGQRAARALWERLPESQQRALLARQERALSPLDGFHETRLGLVEEDEFALWSAYGSPMVVNDTPGSSLAPELDALRYVGRWPEAVQRELMRYYEAVIRKAAHAANLPAEATFIGKNPAFGRVVPQLLEQFPDMRFIHLVRDPVEAIASRLSLIQAIWRLRLGPEATLEQAHVRRLVEESAQTYEQTLGGLAQVPAERVITLPFTRWRRAPVEVAEEIVTRFELGEMRHGARERLMERAAERPPRSALTRDRVTLEAYDIDVAALRERLAAVFATLEDP